MKRNKFTDKKKTMETGKVVDIIRQGAMTYRNGKEIYPILTCPYLPGTKESMYWHSGYEGEKQRQEFKGIISSLINDIPNEETIETLKKTDAGEDLFRVPEPVKKPRKPVNKNLEKFVLKECLTYLKSIGIFCWRNNTGEFALGDRYIRFSVPGASDIIGLKKDGTFLAVECKRTDKKGEQSSNQKLFQYNVEKNNGIYLLIRSVGELKLKIEGIK